VETVKSSGSALDNTTKSSSRKRGKEIYRTGKSDTQQKSPYASRFVRNAGETLPFQGNAVGKEKGSKASRWSFYGWYRGMRNNAGFAGERSRARKKLTCHDVYRLLSWNCGWVCVAF